MAFQKSDVVQEIRRRSDIFEAHFKGKDAAKLVADYYVPDHQNPVMSAPDMALLRGRVAITELFTGLVQNFQTCQLEQVEVFVDVDGQGALAQEFGRSIITGNDGQEVLARYAILWRQSDDGWRVQSDFFAFGDLV